MLKRVNYLIPRKCLPAGVLAPALEGNDRAAELQTSKIIRVVMMTAWIQTRITSHMRRLAEA